jgi:glutamate-1-semialdehyde 2,1-aminomutase
VYETLEARSARLEDGLASNARAAGIPLTINRVGSMICPFFTEGPVTDYESAKTSDLERFKRYYAAMLDAGVSVPPSQFEGMFVSLAHDDDIIEATIAAHRKALQQL